LDRGGDAPVTGPLRRAALVLGALACAGAASAAWWPFGEPSDGKIRPAAALAAAGRWSDVVESLAPQFMQTLRGTDLRSAYVLRGEALERLGRPDEALGDYQVGIGLYPKSVLLLTRGANLLHREGLDEHAREFFARILALEPKNADAHLGLAEIERRLGFLDRSAAHYQAALQTLKTRADLWRDYAEVLLAQNQQWPADLALRKALELEPRDADAHVLLAFARRAQGDYNEALLQLDVAAGLGAGVGTLRAKALWLLEAGKLPEARAAAERVLRSSPADGAALWVRARARLAAGDLSGAEADLSAAEAAEDGGFSARAAKALRAALVELKARREAALYQK